MSSTAALHSEDLYARLGVGRDAPREEIRRAYRALLRQYTPERAPEEFKRLREAYETLNDPHSRAEYDRSPSGAVQQALQLANAAMEAEDYEEAERHLKRVLIEDPELGYARNWLGLCFLYQNKGAQAVVQYERLIKSPGAAAHWYGNAGHAYRSVGRTTDAERVFRRAIAIGDAEGDDITGFYVGLANLYLDSDNYAAAEETLEQAIQHDGQIDFQDMQYFSKLLEVQLRKRDRDEVQRVLRRIQAVACDDDQKRHAALQLGSLARELTGYRGFSFAALVAQTCVQLEPEDADYAGLARLAKLLEDNKIPEARQWMRYHASFNGGGWLAPLVAPVTEHCDEWKAIEHLKPIDRAPSVSCINGIGTRMYGRRDFDPHTKSFVSTYYFVFFFIPIFPLACYRVIDHGARGWRFLGKVPFSGSNKIHMALAAIAVLFLVAGIFEDVQYSGSSAESARSTSTYGSAYQAPGSNSSATSRSAASLNNSRAALGKWIDGERGRVRGLESDLERMQTQLRFSEIEIDGLSTDMQSLESRNRLGGLSDYDFSLYSRSVDAYNDKVDAHNAQRARYRRLYAEYERDLEELNRRIDEYNQ
jgi:tetratricopeptide (TPR) repeat protein